MSTTGPKAGTRIERRPPQLRRVRRLIYSSPAVQCRQPAGCHDQRGVMNTQFRAGQPESSADEGEGFGELGRIGEVPMTLPQIEVVVASAWKSIEILVSSPAVPAAGS